MAGITHSTSNKGRVSGFMLLEGAGQKGGAHSVSGNQEEHKDITCGKEWVKGNKETFPHNPTVMWMH